jgi:peptidoglycan/LPS O-acetylase OafA/YrhL
MCKTQRPNRVNKANVILVDDSTKKMNSAQKYRPDIDGLRAVAVLAVVAFHGFPEYVTGGFVGVDVFFVISGFLISGIIWDETQVGTFSLRRFYARRVRRIFPALLCVLMVSLLAGCGFCCRPTLRA